MRSRRSDKNPKSTEDAIPYLPDNVIEKILSFLSLKDATRATAVSKQWSSLWPCFPVIDLDEGDQTDWERRRIFPEFLRRSLIRCRDQRLLDKLRIRISFNYYSAGMLRQWVIFAIERCVKELHLLNLGDIGPYIGIVDDAVLTLKSLTILSLENVRLYAGISFDVSLPLLKTMSLTEVTFIDEDMATLAFPSLIAGCPSIQHLSIKDCDIGNSTNMGLEISSDSLMSLEIVNCHSIDVVVTAKNLVSFKFYSACRCPDHDGMCLWECDSLEHVDIYCEGLKHLLLQKCFKPLENSFNTPNLVSFGFNGYLKNKVHFVEAPLNLWKVTISIWGASWPFEYFSAMRDFLGSFDCAQKVKLRIHDDECLKIPENCRLEWSSPLPSIKQLLLYFYAPVGDREYYLRPSLTWMAPSAEIILEDEDDDDVNSDD